MFFSTTRWFAWRFFIWALFFLLSALWYGSSAQAVLFPSISLRLSRTTPITNTNAEISFTAPSGIDAPTDTIVVEFQTGFNLTALTISDLALSYGPVTGLENATSIQALPGNGIWGAVIGGQTITLSPPTNSLPGNIPINNKIVLRIGSWAGGTNTITSPVATGIYYVRVTGGLGDAGTAFIAIQSLDSMSVDVTVPTPSQPSPTNNSPASGDTTPPEIRSLRIDGITTSSASVQWTTNELAYGYIEYVLVASGTLLGALDRSDLRTSHQFTVNQLTADTEYRLQVRVMDSATNARWSEPITFRTARFYPRPVISGVEVSYISDRRAVVRWTTNASTTHRTVFQTASTTPRTLSGMVAARSHQVEATDLLPNTEYAFTITATAEGNVNSQATGTLRTLTDTTPPSNVQNFRGTYRRTDLSVLLQWMRPPERDFFDVVITRYTNTSTGEEVPICVTTSTSCIDLGAPTNQRILIYRAVARDNSQNRASGALNEVIIPLLQPQIPTLPTNPTSTRTPLLDRNPPTREESEEPLGRRAPPQPSRAATPRPVSEPDLPALGEAGSSTLPTILSPPTNNEGDSSSTQLTLTETAPSTSTSIVLRPSFYLSESIIASPDEAGVRIIPISHPIEVHIPIEGMDTSLTRIQLRTSEGSIYQFTYLESFGSYTSNFAFVNTQENGFVQIQALFSNGTSWEQSFPFQSIAPAMVVDASEKQTSHPIAEASVTLIGLKTDDSVAETRSRQDGTYILIVTPGRYRMRVSKTGYAPYERTVSVSSGVLSEHISLKRTPLSLMGIVTSNTPLRMKLNNLLSESLLAARIGLDLMRREEVRSITREVVSPIAVVATLGATATAFSTGTLFTYLRFLLTQPLLLFRRRKRKGWGVVYNALSKQPIDLAVVRLLKAGTSFAVQTRITDVQGRFTFFVRPGSYTLQIQRAGFLFPSRFLAGSNTDIDTVDVYHGESFTVKESSVISPNVPIDPDQKEETPAALIRRKHFRTLQSFLGVSGILVSLAVIVIEPTPRMIGLAVFQCLLYALFHRLAIPRKPKHWGIVYDTDGKHPLAKTVVRIFEKKFNKLLETQITGTDGRYGFFARNGVYYLIAEKPGYERYLSPTLDLSKSQETRVEYPFSLKRTASQ